MAFNIDQTFPLDLSAFLSVVKDMAPGNLPSGTSPDCSDMWFGAQYVATRPAMTQALDAALASASINSHQDYPQPTGDTDLILLYSDGSLWQNSVQTGGSTRVGTVAPSSRFKAIAAFDKFFMAFGSLALTSSFTSAQLCGGDIPRYLNTLGHLRRITVDAPGGDFSVSQTNLSPEAVVTPSSYVVGPAITSIISSGARTIHTRTGTYTAYTTYTVTIASAHSLAVGQFVQLYGIQWSGGKTGPQWPGGVQVQSVTSSTVFVIPAAQHTINFTGTTGVFAYTSAATVVRENNYVTAFLNGTSPSSPTPIQEGWFVTLTDSNAAALVGAVPSTGAVPFTSNELFQAIFPSSTGGGSTVTLLTGSVARFYTHTHSFQGSFEYTYPGDGNNIPLPAPANVYNFLNNQGILFNPTSSQLSGYSFTDTNQHPMHLAGVNASGAYDGSNTAMPNSQCSGGSPDENQCMAVTGHISVTTAGTYTFRITHQEGTLFGVGNGAVNPGGNPSVFFGAPQTKTALNGYPLMGACNVSQNFGGYVSPMDISVTFPTAGIYPFELDWCKGDNADTSGAFLGLVMQLMVSGVAKNLVPTTGVGTATIKGDGSGNIHVTLPMAVESLPISGWLYLYISPSTPASVVAWTQTGGGEGVITVNNVNWEEGQYIQLNNFIATSSGFNPTNWNGAIVQITAVDGNEYAFDFSSSVAGSGGAGNGGTATPTTSPYPSGWVQVIQVPDNTHFVYYAPDNTATTTSHGIVYDYFGSLNTQQSLTPTIPGQAVPSVSQSGITQGFQVQSVDTTTTPNTITWYQQGFNDAYTGTHSLQVTPNTQVAGGPRNMFCFFLNEDGGASPGSYPISLQLNGGNQYAAVHLPIGPPGTVGRGVAWTPAYGSDYYVLGSGSVPATNGGAPIINIGTIVQDNTTTDLIMDFADVALVQGILVSGDKAIGSDYGDLTSTIVLPPCLGVIEYAQSLVWWGELNNYPNHSLVNMGMQGGSPSATLAGQLPCGWDSDTVVNSITPDGHGTLATAPDGFGWVYKLTSGAGHTQNCMLSQPAYQNYYGAPVVLPTRSYYLRFNGAVTSGTPTGNIKFVLYSPSSGVLATATVACSGLSSTMTWLGASFSAAMPASIPVDTVFYFTLDGTATTNFTMALRDVQIIDAQQPVLSHQLRVSYPANEFGYDNQNGYVIGLDTTDFIASCFLQRDYLYVNTQNDLHVVKNTGQAPSFWGASLYAQQCGSSGPNSVTTGQSTAWWMGRQGAFVFEGNAPKKINQHVAQDFDKTNWDAAVNSCVGHDPVQRVNYYSFPINGATEPNFVHTMNFRLADAAYNIPDPVHVSPYTGKVIATDLAAKWSQMLLPINSMALCSRQTLSGIAKVMTFGGGLNQGVATGQLYVQDFDNYPPVNPAATFWNCVDTDYGRINSYYQTYFFFSHDVEQQALLSLCRKLYCYMTFHAVGVGQLTITPYVDALNNPWLASPAFTLAIADPGLDYELPLNVTGNRCSFKFAVAPASGQSAAFWLTHMIVWARKDLVFPVGGVI